MPLRVVISYCRADQHLIRPIAKLLSGASAELEGAVYWDDSFRAGESWLTQFQRSMAESDRLFVFWCEHSSASKAVEEEIECARSTSKPIVPVLLDNTPLSPSLSPIHGIDLRPMRIHRLDPLRTLAPRLLQTIETGLRAAFAEGRWIGSIPSCLIAVLVATAWVWLGGGSVIRSVVAAATTVSKVFVYVLFSVVAVGRRTDPC